MGKWTKKVVDLAVKGGKKLIKPAITASIVEKYIKEQNKKGKSWASPVEIAKYFGGTAVDRVMKIGNSIAFQFDLKEPFDEKYKINKAEGGMAYARKKNMGLQMNSGGSVKSKKSKKKSRGTGAAKRGTKFKGIF
jgi:hypothetical protein